MFAPTAGRHVVAVNAETGAELWRFRPEIPKNVRLEDFPARRGLVYWPGNEQHVARILFTYGDWIYALDPPSSRSSSRRSRPQCRFLALQRHFGGDAFHRVPDMAHDAKLPGVSSAYAAMDAWSLGAAGPRPRTQRFSRTLSGMIRDAVERIPTISPMCRSRENANVSIDYQAHNIFMLGGERSS